MTDYPTFTQDAPPGTRQVVCYSSTQISQPERDVGEKLARRVIEVFVQNFFN